MNEAMVYADGFERTFAKKEEMLEFLTRRGEASKWIRKPTRLLRLVPLEKEAGNLEDSEEMEEIVADTEKNTQLVLKIRGESYPVRDCAIKTILSRAGVNGAGLRKLDKATYAKVVNSCLKVANGEALIKVADGKVSAVHGGDTHEYSILDMIPISKGAVTWKDREPMTIPSCLPCGSWRVIRSFLIPTGRLLTFMGLRRTI